MLISVNEILVKGKLFHLFLDIRNLKFETILEILYFRHSSHQEGPSEEQPPPYQEAETDSSIQAIDDVIDDVVSESSSVLKGKGKGKAVSKIKKAVVKGRNFIPT